MMFHLKRGDTLPVLGVYLKNPDKTAHDLTGAAKCVLHVQLSSGVFSRDMTLPADLTSGYVTYAWEATDWEGGTAPYLEVGSLDMEYEVIGAGGGSRGTFPNDGNDRLEVVDDIGEGSA